MSDRQSIPKFILGSAVLITVVLNIQTADATSITIIDPTLGIKHTGVMTYDAPTVYSYIYQSGAYDVEGDYIATVTVTYQGYQTVYQPKFVLVRQEGLQNVN